MFGAVERYLCLPIPLWLNGHLSTLSRAKILQVKEPVASNSMLRKNIEHCQSDPHCVRLFMLTNVDDEDFLCNSMMSLLSTHTLPEDDL